MKCLKLAFIYKNHDTLRYVTFLYKKNPDTSQKARQFALCFIKKPMTLCVTRFFIELLKLAKGDGHFCIKKTIHLALHSYMQKTMHSALRF